MRERDDAIDGGEKAVILHEHRGLDAGKMRACGEADAFLFLGEADESHLRIVFGDLNEVHEPGFREGRKELDAAGFEGAVNELRIFERDGHGSDGDERFECSHGLRFYVRGDGDSNSRRLRVWPRRRYGTFPEAWLRSMLSGESWDKGDGDENTWEFVCGGGDTDGEWGGDGAAGSTSGGSGAGSQCGAGHVTSGESGEW